MTCKTCGCEIFDEDSAFVVNAGLPTEYVQCELCHDSDCDNGRVTMCESCGEYFSTDVLKDEEFFGQSFTECPACHKDIVEGMTREEFQQEYAPERYAVVVRFFCGEQRGYIVRAQDRQEAMKKLVEKVDMAAVAEITIAEILLERDEF